MPITHAWAVCLRQTSSLPWQIIEMDLMKESLIIHYMVLLIMLTSTNLTTRAILTLTALNAIAIPTIPVELQ